jgi:hypothetical protein
MKLAKDKVSFSIKLAAFQASGGVRMKLQLFRQDLFWTRISISCPSS